MGIQIILCVEADKKAETDAIYIKGTIYQFFEIDRSVKLSIIYMNGKTNYASKSVRGKINQLIKDYKNGQSVVIYCVDLDKYESNPVQAKENEDIREFVAKNNYEMVWFCHDIEEVYLGSSIEKRTKKDAAIDFRKKGLISKVDSKKLLSEMEIKGTSNLLLVLDKFLKRKN